MTDILCLSLRECFTKPDTFLSISLYLNVHNLSLKNGVYVVRLKMCLRSARSNDYNIAYSSSLQAACQSPMRGRCKATVRYVGGILGETRVKDEGLDS